MATSIITFLVYMFLFYWYLDASTGDVWYALSKDKEISILVVFALFHLTIVQHINVNASVNNAISNNLVIEDIREEKEEEE